MSNLGPLIVTGAGGFIGRVLANHLLAEGHEVTGLGRTPGMHGEAVVDLAIPGALDSFLTPDTTVFHLAGSGRVGTSVKAPIADFEANVVVSINVLEAARRCGAQVVFASTGSVYDREGDLPFGETSPARPSSPYAAGKLAVEGYMQAYFRSYGVKTWIARMFSVYGPGMHQMAVNDFVDRLRKDRTRLEIRGDGRQTRDYLHVADVARALTMIVERGEPGGIYNVASGKGVTIRQVAALTAEALGIDGCEITGDFEHTSSELDHMVADITRLKKLGFAQSVPIRTGVSETARALWLASEEKPT